MSTPLLRAPFRHAFSTVLLCVTGPTVASQTCGGEWAAVPTPTVGPSTHQLLGLSGLHPDEAWAVGTYYEPTLGDLAALALHRSGGTWTPVPPPSLPYSFVMKSVDEIAPNDVWAVGGHGVPYAFHFDGNAWSVEKLPSPGPFDAGISVEDVVAVGPNDVWAVGFYDHTLTAHLRTAVWHWDGEGWSVVPSPSIPSPSDFYPSMLLSIAAADPATLFAVGEWRIGNTWFPLAMRWSGSTWTLLSPPSSSTFGDGRLRSVSARSANDVWAVGTTDDHDGVIGAGYGRAFALHYDGSAWTEIGVPQPSPWSVNPLRAVLAGPQGVFAAGTWENATQGLDTFILRYDGPSFAVMPSPNVPGDGQGWNQLHDLADLGGEVWTAGEGNPSFFSAPQPLVARLVDPCGDSVTTVGTGTPGCAGPLSIGATSEPHIGSSGFSISIAALAPSAPGLALLGDAADADGTLVESFGLLLHLDLGASTFLLPFGFQSGPAGKAVLPIPIPPNPELVGKVFVLQAFGYWAPTICQPTPSGWSSSPGLMLTIET